MEKTYMAKTPPSDFQVTLPKFHYYHNNQLQIKESQYFIPTYSWTFTPIPNWTYSAVTISPFNAQLPNTWLTNARIPVRDFNHQLEKVVGCKILQFIHTMKIKKMFGHKTLRCTNTATSSKEMNKSKTLYLVTICLNKLFSKLVQLVYSLTALKIIILYV